MGNMIENNRSIKKNRIEERRKNNERKNIRELNVVDEFEKDVCDVKIG